MTQNRLTYIYKLTILAERLICSQNCEFILQLLGYFLTRKLRVISHNSEKKVIARKQVIIARYKSNSEKKSQNCEFISTLCLTIASLYHTKMRKKKSEL